MSEIIVKNCTRRIPEMKVVYYDGTPECNLQIRNFFMTLKGRLHATMFVPNSYIVWDDHIFSVYPKEIFEKLYKIEKTLNEEVIIKNYVRRAKKMFHFHRQKVQVVFYDGTRKSAFNMRVRFAGDQYPAILRDADALAAKTYIVWSDDDWEIYSIAEFEKLYEKEALNEKLNSEKL